MALKRLEKEFENLQTNPIPDAFVTRTKDPFLWRVYLKGPKKTAYEGGVFDIELRFARDYPKQPPTLRFITKIFHSNIDTNGIVCVPLIYDWNPIIPVSTILLALNDLLVRNNGENEFTVRSMTEEQYNEEAKRWTQTYARNSPVPKNYLKY